MTTSPISNLDVTATAKNYDDRVADAVCRAGDSKKQMDNLVSRALDGYPLWRIRACRLGEAGGFSGSALLDLEAKVSAFFDKRQRLEQAKAATEDIIANRARQRAGNPSKSISLEEFSF